jgi:hypothetical protein
VISYLLMVLFDENRVSEREDGEADCQLVKEEMSPLATDTAR